MGITIAIDDFGTGDALREMGITIAIDDFGTGFSSLSYLAKLPVDTLKIDRSFILNMASGPQGVALVSTIVNLGHSLGLKVVAEGVETEDQSRHLALLGCDEIQGYLLSKPVPAERAKKCRPAGRHGGCGVRPSVDEGAAKISSAPSPRSSAYLLSAFLHHLDDAGEVQRAVACQAVRRIQIARHPPQRRGSLHRHRVLLRQAQVFEHQVR
eukprot:gene952-1339_t